MKYDITSEGQKVRIYERLQTMQKTLVTLCVILIILLVAVIAGIFLILGNQAQIMIQQTDTLDQIMELRQEQEVSWFDEDIDLDFWDDIVTPPDQIVTYQLSPDERALIERVVMSESSIEPFQAQVAVAQTIYDRMNDWGDPLPVAIRTYSQQDNGDPTDSVKLAVSNVFDKGIRIYDGGTYQFHDDTVLPYWVEGKIARGSIGRLSFYGGYAE